MSADWKANLNTFHPVFHATGLHYVCAGRCSCHNTCLPNSDSGGRGLPFMLVYSAVALVAAAYFVLAGHACAAEKDLPDNFATAPGKVIFLTIVCLFFSTAKK